jgi:Fe-S cluster biogenesis protein NfuA
VGQTEAAVVIDQGQVEETLDLIRPAIQMDGGDIVLESIRGGVVTVQLLGTCDGCPMSPVTLRQGVERLLRERVPGVTEVVSLEVEPANPPERLEA